MCFITASLVHIHVLNAFFTYVIIMEKCRSSFGIYEGIHRLGLGGVVTGIYFLLMNFAVLVSY